VPISKAVIPPLAVLCALLDAELELLGSSGDAELRFLEIRRALEADRAADRLGLPRGCGLHDLVRSAPSPWSDCLAALGSELRAACRRRGDDAPLSLRDFLEESVGA